MPSRTMVEVPGGVLEAEETGTGDLVVVIQTALDVDELTALAQALADRGRRVVHYRRRGYGASGPPHPQPSVDAEAADCAALVRAVGAGPAHVVGASYSAALALSTAATAVDAVATVTAVEPPPVHAEAGAEFAAANEALLRTFDERGARAALDDLMSQVAGPSWRVDLERDRPGSVASSEAGSETFFRSDVPALLCWRFTAAEAAAVRCPVLHVGGDRSGPWFRGSRDWLCDLLPRTEDATVHGAGHLVALTHADEVAAVIDDFLRRAPVP